jgi:nitric oxide reductase subunit C
MRCWLLRLVALVSLLTACSGGSSDAPTSTLDALAEHGRRVFTQNCATCHALAPDTLIVGPSLAGVAARAGSRLPDLDAQSYIELSILRPDAYIVSGFSDLMPKDFGKKLTGEEFDALVAFLLTLE